MLKIDINEICPHSSICPYSDGCGGKNPKRKTQFICSIIEFENGKPYFGKDEKFRKSEFDLKGTNKKILHG